MEGSKDGDFTADLLAGAADSEDSAEAIDPPGSTTSSSGNITGLKRSKVEGGSGVKLEQEDMGGKYCIRYNILCTILKQSYYYTNYYNYYDLILDLACEIASEIRRKEREERSKTGHSKGSAQSESSDEEDEAGEGEDGAAVVEIEEPDQLALLYMSMAKEMNKLRGSSSSGGSLAQPLQLQDSAPVAAVQSIAKYSGSTSSAISLLSPTAAVKTETMQVGREGIAQSLLGVGYTGSLGSGEVEVIDLFAEEESEGVGLALTAGCNNSAAFFVDEQCTTGNTADTAIGTATATAEEEGTEYGAASYLAEEETEATATAVTSSHNNTSETSNPSILPTTTTTTVPSTLINNSNSSSSSSSFVLNETEFFPEEDSNNFSSKEILAAKAQKAWNSSAFLPIQRNNKPVMKFKPTLKRPERNNSTESLTNVAENISNITVSSITTTENENSIQEK